MKLALLSDIHANVQAFDACLAHARALGAEQYALLGDLVGYGADPAAVVERAQDLAEGGALLIKGNHDAMAVLPPADVNTVGESTAAWTHAQLDASQRQFLDGLPLTLQQRTILLVHASVDDPGLWRYVYDQRAATASLDAAATLPEVRYVFGGHVHMQSLYYRGAGAGLMKFMPTPGVAVPVPRHRHWLATIGSVGQPRDGNPQAMYALFDTDKLQLAFQRVSYDHQAAATAIRQAGLPAFFADRLELGR
ncbi:MAG: metallophosphoesterase family protein [Rhodoferax sp.]|uniref:metallophosphoesterase family protein n=1 Tax=Rhodoferax sp. TaxID=50421 RepID=UPI0027203C76|nr:metallophosphoesterase family protein [Rhodoferax sp.]MDO8448147.1 metallophosphoesterase family protein [Rhodoferax sp.]